MLQKIIIKNHQIDPPVALWKKGRGAKNPQNSVNIVYECPQVKPLHIFISGLDGFDVRKIDDIEYTVEISCYFLTKWRDDRLILHEDIRALNEVKNDTAVEETWFPIDLEFVSKVRQSFITLT